MKKLSTILLSVFIVSLLLIGSRVIANPSYFVASSGTATTTLTYMSPGTATTTVYFDAQVGTQQALDSAKFLVQFTGSSTASVINVDYEYAVNTAGFDCTSTPTACDWYADNLSQTATTSAKLDSSNSFTLNFASTTQGKIAGTGTRLLRIVDIQTPTRYVRANISMPINSQKGAVWAQFIGKRQGN